MINPSDHLSQIKGIGPAFIAKLKKLDIETVKDLLWHFPFRYEDFSQIVKISDLKVNERATIQGMITAVKLKRTWKRRMFIVEALISDDTGTIKAVWFNQRFLLSILKKGKLVNLAGKVVSGPEGIALTHPIYELVTQGFTEEGEAPDTKHTGRLIPIYPETKRVTSKMLRFFAKSVLENLEKLDDPIPAEILEKHNFPEINQALNQIHFPENLKQAKIAKKRFAFEDLFLLQLANLRQRLALAKEKAYGFPADIEYIKSLLETLPFELTQSQKKSLWEILQDISRDQPMNRLLQGDVGSGKTIVAALAALLVARGNKPFDAAPASGEARHQGRQGKQTPLETKFLTGQSAFMAPTEVLARQHYQTFKKFFSDFGKGVGLLTSAEAKVFYGDGLEGEIKKSELVKKIAGGEVKIVIGTHALIQKNIKFNNLAFVVIDEQHRFGVRQRAELVSRRQTRTDTQTNADNINTQTDADSNEGELLYQDITYKIRSVIFTVRKSIGLGHKENIYQKAIEEELSKNNFFFEKEKSINIIYDNKKIGVYRPDFIIENKIILEIKALPFIGDIEKRQIWNYLKGSEYKLALLVNFSNKTADIHRVIYEKARESLRMSASSPRKSALILPHLLSMSATPIPRTLSLTIFGDLDLSIIDELPKGRKEIITKIVAPANRDRAYAFIRGQVKKGRQVFVICPRIESTQTDTDDTQTKTEIPYESVLSPYKSVLEARAVKEEFEKLSKKVFPDLRVGLLHGKLKAKEKAEVMRNFKEGRIDVLVSTSVVEVGVDIPNATIMMIEGAEKFGLAQLYQFRGRVGRGEHQSFCFLFTDSAAKSTHKRLHSLLEAKNGFELAEKDLEIRGPGEFLGESQTGLPDLAMKAVQNPELVKSSREAAEEIIKNDPELKNHPLLLKRLESFEKEVHLE